MIFSEFLSSYTLVSRPRNAVINPNSPPSEGFSFEFEPRQHACIPSVYINTFYQFFGDVKYFDTEREAYIHALHEAIPAKMQSPVWRVKLPYKTEFMEAYMSGLPIDGNYYGYVIIDDVLDSIKAEWTYETKKSTPDESYYLMVEMPESSKDEIKWLHVVRE